MNCKSLRGEFLFLQLGFAVGHNVPPYQNFLQYQNLKKRLTAVKNDCHLHNLHSVTEIVQIHKNCRGAIIFSLCDFL